MAWLWRKETLFILTREQGGMSEWVIDKIDYNYKFHADKSETCEEEKKLSLGERWMRKWRRRRTWKGGRGKNVIMMRVTFAFVFYCTVWFCSLDWTLDLLPKHILGSTQIPRSRRSGRELKNDIFITILLVENSSKD